jgi:hypothetical protein
MQRLAATFALPLACQGVTPLLSDDHDRKTDVTISDPLQIPGGTVLAGEERLLCLPGLDWIGLVECYAFSLILLISFVNTLNAPT